MYRITAGCPERLCFPTPDNLGMEHLADLVQERQVSEIPSVRIGPSVRFRTSDIQNYMMKRAS